MVSVRVDLFRERLGPRALQGRNERRVMKRSGSHLVAQPRNEQHALFRERPRMPECVEARRILREFTDERGPTRPSNRPRPGIDLCREGTHLLRRGGQDHAPEIRTCHRHDAVDLGPLGAGDQGREAPHAMPN